MKLVCFYDIEKYNNENRVFAPSVATVIDYISSTLHELKIDVEIISPAETRNNYGRYKFRKDIISKGITLTQCSTIGHNNLFLKILSKIKSRIWLVIYLLMNTKRNELVFFWDSPVMFEPLFLFKLFDRKKVKVLYFASEIHQEVIPLGKLKRKLEFKLFSYADCLMVSTELLEKRINKDKKKSIIVYGTYSIVPNYNESFNDGLIHILYAGVINRTKGSSKAIEIAKYLPNNYHINIIGYGKDNDVKEMIKDIEEANKTNSCKITYDGILRGDEYNHYLQKCDIGLCSQNLDATYNESSFPSKILSYMSNGLRVVSVDLKTIRNSKICDYIFFTNSDSAEDFAETIKKIDFKKKYDSRSALQSLDSEFKKELSDLLKNQVVE